MADGLDLSELDAFTDNLIRSSKNANKLQRKFLQKQGSKLARKTKAKARAEVNMTAVKRKKYSRKAGQYHASIKRGKVYEKDGALQIRAYSSDPIAHLIEDGYTPKLRDGSSGSHQSGKNIFDDTRKTFDSEFRKSSEDIIDEMIKEICK